MTPVWQSEIVMPRARRRRARLRDVNMARKTNKKSKAKKVIKRAGKKPKRAPAGKTKAKKVAKKVHKAKATKARKPTKKSIAEDAAIRIDNMAYGLGYLIP